MAAVLAVQEVGDTAESAQWRPPMNVRKFGEKTQHDHICRVETFAKFLRRSPETATAKDLHRSSDRDRHSATDREPFGGRIAVQFCGHARMRKFPGAAHACALSKPAAHARGASCKSFIVEFLD
jgi:hypothetical protein